MTAQMAWLNAFGLVLLAGSALCQMTTTMPPPPKDLEAELTARGGYTQILSLLKSTGLLSTLMSVDNITLFAPTDAALSRVPSDQLAALVADTNELKRILGYHAVLSDVKGLHQRNIRKLHDKIVTSSNNMPIRINVYQKVHSVAAEGVNITDLAIRVSNGYVHGIDGIMIPPEGNIVDIVTKRPDLSALVTLLSAASLVDVIKDDQNITVFAPSNDAFNKVDPVVLNYLNSHPDALQDVLLYHVIEKMTLYSVGMRHTLTFHSADMRHENLMIFEDFVSGGISVNTANVVEKDISGTNGVIHIIDEVLLPARVLLEMESNGIVIG